MINSRYLILISFVIAVNISVNTSAQSVDKDYFKIYEDLFDRGILYRLGIFLKNNTKYDYTTCTQDISTWLNSISSIWALEMHDANGKLPPAILKGHMQTFGAYDECLRVYNKSADGHEIKGKYCLAKLPITPGVDMEQTKLMRQIRIINAQVGNQDALARVGNVDVFGRFVLNWGVCIPSSCAAEEIQTMLRDLLQSMGVGVPTRPLLTVPENECIVDEPTEWSGGSIAAITVFSAFALVIVVSSIYDLYTRNNAEDTRLHQLFVAFSLYTNTKKLMKINKGSSNLRCINGIRVMSICWVMIGHRYTMLLSLPMLNTFDTINWVKTIGSTFILNGTLAVDTFFTLSGLLLAYTFFKQFGGKVDSFNLPLFYFHRFLRLWPAMAMTIFFQTYLYPHLGDGPLWSSFTNLFTEPCYDHWWSALLYVQNYVNPLTQCVAQLWYLCCDTQLYIVSPILLYPLLYRPKIGIINLIIWIIIAQASVTSLAYVHLWASSSGTIDLNAEQYLIRYYNVPHARATPWLIGFAAGYFLYKYPKRSFDRPIPLIAVLLYWIVPLGIITSTIIGSVNNQGFDHVANKLQDSTFLAFARTGWGIAIVMIILACTYGYGGPINWLLSLRIWEILGRLTYSMYLLHIMMQYLQASSKRTSMEFKHFQFVYSFFGDLVITVIVSYLWCMAFESPFLAIERALFHKKPIEVRPKKQVSDNETGIVD